MDHLVAIDTKRFQFRAQVDEREVVDVQGVVGEAADEVAVHVQVESGAGGRG